MSTQITAESAKQTATRAKSRPSGKSHTTTGGVSPSAQHTKASQAKTVTQLQPRKASTTFYPAQGAGSSSGNNAATHSSKNGFNSSHHHAMYQTSGANHERPHTAMAGHISHQTQPQQSSSNNRSFTGTATHSHAGLAY